jgi:hypothetical protein
MCQLEDIYHSCGHWGPQRFIGEHCIRSRTVSGHILPCDYKETNGMSNSEDFCPSCKRALRTYLEMGLKSSEPLLPPPSSRFGSVSSTSSEAPSMGSMASMQSPSPRPVIRIKRLSAGKIHWVSGAGKGLNWYWFGRRKNSESDSSLQD